MTNNSSFESPKPYLSVHNLKQQNTTFNICQEVLKSGNLLHKRGLNRTPLYCKVFKLFFRSAIVIVNLMKDLVMRRPTKKLNCLHFLLEFCYHEVPEVRKTAITTVLQLHGEKDFKNIIEEYAKMYLKFLLQAAPPDLLFSEGKSYLNLKN